MTATGLSPSAAAASWSAFVDVLRAVRARTAGWPAEIDRICRDLGISLHQLISSQPLELALFDFLQSRMHVGRQTARAGNRAARYGDLLEIAWFHANSDGVIHEARLSLRLRHRADCRLQSGAR